MSKDPAFLFYPADASEDTQFMNRLERGAYFDLVKSQRLFHGFTVVQLRKILGKDFEEVWPSIELVLKKEGDEYYVGWVRESIVKREEYSLKQSNRVSKRYNHGKTVDVPKIVNEIGNEIEDVIEVKNGKDFVLKLLEQFQESYLDYMGLDYDVVNAGKDRAAIGKLLKIFKEKNPDQTSEQTIEGFRKFFDMCMQIDDDWIRSNMSPSIVLSKLNEIKNKIQNGTKRKTGKSGATDAEIATVIAKHWANG
jgi:hypothetical protein